MAFRRKLEQVTTFFRDRAVVTPKGLDSLSLEWLNGLPGILWSLRKPGWTHIPFMICELRAAEGMLQVRFAQEAFREPGDDHFGAFDRVRIAVNASLYPSRWRPLKRQCAMVLTCRQRVSLPSYDPRLVRN